jgi:hypothetical protein
MVLLLLRFFALKPITPREIPNHLNKEYAGHSKID